MAGSKRFAATGRKLKRAREDGDVAKSRDLTAVVVLSVGFCWIYWGLSPLERVLTNFKTRFSALQDFSTESMLLSAADALEVIGYVLVPALALVAISGLLVELFQAGFHFSLKPLAPKMSRLDIGENLKRILGIDEANESSLPTTLLFELAKSSIQITVFTVLMVGVLLWAVPVLVVGAVDEMHEVLKVGRYVSVRVGALLLLAVLLAAIADFYVVRRRRAQRLRMDAEEFKRELRESDGDPELRGMRKQLHQEAAFHGIVQNVRRAKVVVVDS